MSFVRTIKYKEATGKLKRLYEKVKGPNNSVDNILMVHSLRPHTLVGHMSLYKSVLHHNENKLPQWFLETLGVYVSRLNGCAYCIEHHFNGLKKVLNNDAKALKIKTGLESDNFDFLDKRMSSALVYANKLTKEPNSIKEKDIMKLRNEGLDDGEILEINQVVGYFNYANRTVLGLGVSHKGDTLGLSPTNADNNNWNHQ